MDTAKPILLDRVPLVDLLAMIPDDESSREWVWISDHDLNRRIEDAGEYDPTKESAHEWVESWYSPSTNGSFFLKWRYPSDDDVAAFLREFGVWINDVDQEIAYGFLPRYTKLFTFDDPAAVDQAVRNDPVWNDSLEVTATPPVTVYSWGDGEASLKLATAARPQGEAGQLTVIEGMAPSSGAADDLLIRTQYAEQVEVALDPIVGSGTSLAEDETYQRLADVLDAEGASSVVLTADLPLASQYGHVLIEDPKGGPGDFLDANPLLADYEALGVGRVPREDGWAAVMVLAHATEQSAVENARRLALQLESGTTSRLRTYADLLAIDTVDTIGTLVVARFAPDEHGPWKMLNNLLGRNESLFWIDDIRPAWPTA